MSPPKTTTRTLRGFRLENALWDAILERYTASGYSTLTDFMAAVLANAIGQELPPPPPPPPAAPQVAALEKLVARQRALLGECRKVFARLLAAYRIDPTRYRSVDEAAHSIPKPALWAWCGWWEVRRAGLEIPPAPPKKK